MGWLFRLILKNQVDLFVRVHCYFLPKSKVIHCLLGPLCKALYKVCHVFGSESPYLSWSFSPVIASLLGSTVTGEISDITSDPNNIQGVKEQTSLSVSSKRAFIQSPFQISLTRVRSNAYSEPVLGKEKGMAMIHVDQSGCAPEVHAL